MDNKTRSYPVGHAIMEDWTMPLQSHPGSQHHRGRQVDSIAWMKDSVISRASSGLKGQTISRSHLIDKLIHTLNLVNKNITSAVYHSIIQRANVGERSLPRSPTNGYSWKSNASEHDWLTNADVLN